MRKDKIFSSFYLVTDIYYKVCELNTIVLCSDLLWLSSKCLVAIALKKGKGYKLQGLFPGALSLALSEER
jgi:hypothetical protein